LAVEYNFDDATDGGNREDDDDDPVAVAVNSMKNDGGTDTVMTCSYSAAKSRLLLRKKPGEWQ
jgi:hypothetical protein